MSKFRVLLLVAVAIGVATFFALNRQPALHARVTPQRIDAPQQHWRDHGFVKMVPPVRLPSDQKERDHIQVWLKVGDGLIDARRLDDGRVTLSFPRGTIADRVESVGTAVVDVRGTTLVDDGELFHVYVAEDEAPSALVGWEWRRDDFDAEASATSALLARLEQTHRVLRGEAPPSDEQHQKSLASYRKNNNCGSCHAHEKPPVVAGDTTHRPTDSSGFFVPLSVLADVVPLERHRPWDMNAGDPFLTISCPHGGEPRLRAKDAARLYVCPNKEIPVGRLDVAAGLAQSDERTLAMCASRRYLFDHMTEGARALFASAFGACGIPTKVAGLDKSHAVTDAKSAFEVAVSQK